MDRRDRLRDGLPLERAASRQQLVQHAPERPDVGAPVHVRRSARLLGAHVGRGAEDDVAGRLERRLHLGRIDVPIAGNESLGQPEVEDLDLAFRGDLDVRRLEVAVHDAAVVRRRDAASDLARQLQRLFDTRRLSSEALLQGLSVDVLEDEERLPGVLLEPIDGGDVGVVERGKHTRFALEPRQRHRIAHHLGREELDRDRAMEHRVLGAPDDAHPAFSQLGEQLVVRDGRARFHHSDTLEGSILHAEPSIPGGAADG